VYHEMEAAMSTVIPGDADQTRTPDPEADPAPEAPRETRQRAPEGDEGGKEEAGYGYGV
jgi:hypothetical protein